MVTKTSWISEDNNHCLEVIPDFNNCKKRSKSERNGRNKRRLMANNSDNNEDLLIIEDLMATNRHSIEKLFNELLHKVNTDPKFTDFRDSLNINDNYFINKNEFKDSLLPKLLKLATDGSQKATALAVLSVILFNDWKSQKSKLSEKALKASLIPQLISIYCSTNETEIHELIFNLYLLLLLIIANTSKRVMALLLLPDNLLINDIIGVINESNDVNLVTLSLKSMQFYLYYCRKFDTISAVLPVLTKLLNQTNMIIVAEVCNTIYIFTQMFQSSRKAVIASQVCHKLLDLWSDTTDEAIIKPIYSIFVAIVSRFNEYKNSMLGPDLNVLKIIPQLISSTDLNKLCAINLIKCLAMKPICAKHYLPQQQIQQIIDSKTICLINDLIENNDNNSDILKSSAVNAIFVMAYNASIDQLKYMADQGCLKALCSLLDTQSEQSYQKYTLLAITVFLYEEFKDQLKSNKALPDPSKQLSSFATIIRNVGGLQKLNQLNQQSEDDVKQYVEEILVNGFGIETRPNKRQPSMKVMETRLSLIACMDCKADSANTVIYQCKHVHICRKCAASALNKIYTGERQKKCLIKDCGALIKTDDCPWFRIKGKLYKLYILLEDQLERKLEVKILK
ncbi:uncharacterized protein LOC128964150 [Oppia nitens]|uniref:uncharacterized protein LOC128964150 n=1 Tax=Oppia nitens TaxID=1686743 RepID=UPI0023DB23A5|nr:uncharacterized protein LOC128964150 [Oppia nitens]